MKVLHVIARMNVGGTATYLTNLLSGLDEANINYLLAFGDVTPDETEDIRVRNVTHWRIKDLSRDISVMRDIRARRSLKKLIQEFQPEIIHTHTFKAGALVRTIKTSIPLVHTFHGHHLYDPDYGFLKKFLINSIEGRLAKKNARIVSIGEKVARELLTAGIGDKEKVISIPPGISTPILSDRSEMYERYGLEPGKINVLWMGRLTHVKRPDRALEVAKGFPGSTFLMCGSGELREKLESHASGNVKFMGVQKAEHMLSIADIALLTSDSEGMPLTLIEAQMSGIPAIATNVGSVSEIVRDGETGFITDCEVPQIENKLGELIKNSEMRKSMSKLAMEQSTLNFSISRMVNSHVSLYRQVLSERNI